MKQGAGSAPMIKSWLLQVVRKIRETAPKEARAVDFPLAVEVTGAESTRWVITLGDGKVDTRTKEEISTTLFVSQNQLRVLSMRLRYAVWKQAFESGSIRLAAEDKKQVKTLDALAKSLGTA